MPEREKKEDAAELARKMFEDYKEEFEKQREKEQLLSRISFLEEKCFSRDKETEELQRELNKERLTVEKLLDRVAFLEGEVAELKLNDKSLADGVVDLGGSVKRFQEGQLSTPAKARLAGYSAGGGLTVAGIIEIIKGFL